MSDSLRAFLERLTTWLEAAAVPYMLAGSFASTLHGRPRSTQDVDLVIDPTKETLRAFVAQIPQEHACVDLSTALEALRTRDMFNIIDVDTRRLPGPERPPKLERLTGAKRQRHLAKKRAAAMSNVSARSTRVTAYAWGPVASRWVEAAARLRRGLRPDAAPTGHR